jgi:5-methylcytosine-specific restriction endonuclease McrA
MNPGLPMRRRRLSAEAYRKLHQEILERDSWRCQACGSLRGLEVHHIQRRSQSGDDSEGNLITLCSDCHEAIHTCREGRTLRGRTSG